jgi:predicted DNA-binding protein with PD1-like motif
MYSHGKFYVTRLKPRQDLKIAIEEFIRLNSIKAGAIVSAVGSLEQYNLRYANQPVGKTMTGYFEIVSLTGTLSENGCHIHMSVSNGEGRVIGGHVLTDNLIYTTAEIVLVEFSDLEFERTIDPTYGYEELIIHGK